MLSQAVSEFSNYIWNFPIVILCLAAALFFTARLSFIQIRCFGEALSIIFRPDKNFQNENGNEQRISPLQALTATVSSAVGLGNVAGVAIAIALGGPGAVFWMWMTGLLGMATKFAECTLGSYYREVNEETGESRGGPMYYIVNGLGPKWKPVSMIFAFCMAVSVIGVGGMFQTNQTAAAFKLHFGMPLYATGGIFLILGAFVILGGIKRIGRVTSYVVPVMGIIYVLGSMAVIILCIEQVPAAFMLIFQDAFSGQAIAGGAVGTVIIIGVRRSIFSNGAGDGTAPIAYAAVRSGNPVREGIVALLVPFIDTIIICSCTAMVIILSGYLGIGSYTPVSNEIISFESNREISHAKGWRLVAADKKTDEMKGLSEMIHGRNVLGTVSGNAVTEPLELPPIAVAAPATSTASGHHSDHVACGIRFSVLRKSGHMRLDVLDGERNIIGQVGFVENPAVSLNTENGLFVLKTDGMAGKWQRVALLFSEHFTGSLNVHPERSSIILRFVPENTTGNIWMMDRFQTVKEETGIALTMKAYGKYFGIIAPWFISLSIFFFAFTTLITFSYYGETSAVYLLGSGIITLYRIIFLVLSMLGAILDLKTVLSFSDGMLGIVVIINLIVIFALSPKLVMLTRDYFQTGRQRVIKPLNSGVKGTRGEKYVPEKIC